MESKRITDSLFYFTKENFNFGLEDEKERQFGIMFEISDVRDYGDEDEDESYPFAVSAAIVANEPHKSFYEGEGEPTKESLLWDTYSYMGGVPVDHILTDAVGAGFKELAEKFKITEARIQKRKHTHGTVAAQRGAGVEHSHLMFADEDQAIRFIEILEKERVGVLGIMIGFILDAPINMAGQSGWTMIETMVKGRG